MGIIKDLVTRDIGRWIRIVDLEVLFETYRGMAITINQHFIFFIV